MRIYRGDNEIEAAVELRADKPADVCVNVPGSGLLRLTFSDSELLPDGRRVSFKLHGTTLFSERAVAWCAPACCSTPGASLENFANIRLLGWTFRRD